MMARLPDCRPALMRQAKLRYGATQENKMIKFNQNNVTDGTNRIKVWYSFSGEIICVYAKEYGRQLSKIFDDVVNDTDTMTDYFDKDSIYLNPGDEHYAAAKAAGEKKNAANKKRWEETARKRHAKRYGTDQAANLRQMVAEG